MPAFAKELMLRQAARENCIRVLIETGTLWGETIYALRKMFSQIYSIELSAELANAAIYRFKFRKHIRIVQGDSSQKIPEIIRGIDMPILFWLDGHYSGSITAKGQRETPILEELKAIFAHHRNDHVILIDDARCFTGANDYPTMDTLSTFVKSSKRYNFIDVMDDVIVIKNVLQS